MYAREKFHGNITPANEVAGPHTSKLHLKAEESKVAILQAVLLLLPAKHLHRTTTIHSILLRTQAKAFHCAVSSKTSGLAVTGYRVLASVVQTGHSERESGSSSSGEGRRTIPVSVILPFEALGFGFGSVSC